MKEIIKKYYQDAILVLLVLLPVVLLVIFKDSIWIFNSREGFQEFVRGYGALAPFVIIGIIIFEVIVAPLPGFVPLISSGFIFGPIEGSLYAYIGNFVGSALVFAISRKFGRRLVTKIIREEKLKRYEAFVNRKCWILFALYFFPIFPTDIISFAIGLSRVKFKKFLLIIAIGFLFNVLALNYFGDLLARLYFR